MDLDAPEMGWDHVAITFVHETAHSCWTLLLKQKGVLSSESWRDHIWGNYKGLSCGPLENSINLNICGEGSCDLLKLFMHRSKRFQLSRNWSGAHGSGKVRTYAELQRFFVLNRETIFSLKQRLHFKHRDCQSIHIYLNFIFSRGNLSAENRTQTAT